jgi:hypothetical protein
MKKLFLILIASLALLVIKGPNPISADGGGGIPLAKLAGRYAETTQGSLTLCFKPDFSATEACSTAGAVAVAFNVVAVGHITSDKVGNSCGTGTSTSSASGDVHPPAVGVANLVTTLTAYDSATGSGDGSYTNYAGGKCTGSKFDSTGATVLNFGTFHIVASDNGERTDFVITTATDSGADIGAFNLLGFNLKQKE